MKKFLIYITGDVQYDFTVKMINVFKYMSTNLQILKMEFNIMSTL